MDFSFTEDQAAIRDLAGSILEDRVTDERVKQLAAEQQIPPTGALALLRSDPKTQGPRLFAKNCASCHDYVDPNGQDSIRIVQQRLQMPAIEESDDPNAKPTIARDENGKVTFQPSGAPNLYNFASRKWIEGLLDPKQISRIEAHDLLLPPDAKESDPAKYLREVTAAPYFGNTSHAGGEMTDFVQNNEAWVELRDGGKTPSIDHAKRRFASAMLF